MLLIILVLCKQWCNEQNRTAVQESTSFHLMERHRSFKISNKLFTEEVGHGSSATKINNTILKKCSHKYQLVRI